MNKKVIFHIDDIGSSFETNNAAKVLFDKGITKSGSVMVPCNAFDNAVKKFRNDLTLDLGVHLTLTSERDEGFERRKPTLPQNKVKSLIGKDGYFHKTIDDVFSYAKESEIKKELINQINIAKESGITVSHIDSHMGVLLHKKLFHIYKEIAEVFKIQPFIINPKKYYKNGYWFYDCEESIKSLSKNGFNVFDDIEPNSIPNSHLNYEKYFKNRLLNIKNGTTYFLLHVLDQPNIKISPDALSRFNEFCFFSNDKAFYSFKNLGISPIKTNNSPI